VRVCVCLCDREGRHESKRGRERESAGCTAIRRGILGVRECVRERERERESVCMCARDAQQLEQKAGVCERETVCV